jgi:hypothetical protein
MGRWRTRGVLILFATIGMPFLIHGANRIKLPKAA